jgi:hypothetical protein
MGIHLLCCIHGNVCMGPWCNLQHFCCHCVKCWLPCGMRTTTCASFDHFQSSHWWINIVFTKDGICTLTNIVIIDPTCPDLLLWSYTTQGFVAFDAIQAKKRSYCNLHPIDQFLPLVIEVFECLHKQVNVFLHNYANVIWSLKRPKGFLFSILVNFFHQKISITL